MCASGKFSSLVIISGSMELFPYETLTSWIQAVAQPQLKNSCIDILSLEMDTTNYHSRAYQVISSFDIIGFNVEFLVEF